MTWALKGGIFVLLEPATEAPYPCNSKCSKEDHLPLSRSDRCHLLTVRNAPKSDTYKYRMYKYTLPLPL